MIIKKAGPTGVPLFYLWNVHQAGGKSSDKTYSLMPTKSMKNA